MYFSRKRELPYTTNQVSSKFRTIKKSYCDKKEYNRGTGGGPAKTFTSCERLFGEYFGSTVHITGLIADGVEEVGVNIQNADGNLVKF